MFFRDHLIPRVPDRLRGRLEFEGLYEAFGGKLAHWQDFITDFGTFSLLGILGQNSRCLFSQLSWPNRYSIKLTLSPGSCTSESPHYSLFTSSHWQPSGCH